MNMLRQSMIQEAISKAAAAGELTVVDFVSKYLPNDFDLLEAELVVAGALPAPPSKAQPQRRYTPEEVTALRNKIVATTTARAKLLGELSLAGRDLQQARTRLAERSSEFVAGRPRITDAQLRQDYFRSEQRKRELAAQGRLPPAYDGTPIPKDPLTRSAVGTQRRRGAHSFNRPGAFPPNMRGHYATKLADGRTVISRTKPQGA